MAQPWALPIRMLCPPTRERLRTGLGAGVAMGSPLTPQPASGRLRAHSKNLPIGAAEPPLDWGAAEPPYGMGIGPADPEEKGIAIGMAIGPADPEKKGLAIGPADPPNAIGTAAATGTHRRQ
jgi:hypothetical protein